MSKRSGTWLVASVVLVFLAAAGGARAQSTPAATQSILIKAQKPYDALVQRIEARGGVVTHQYKYWNGIAAEIPMSALRAVTDLSGAGSVTKDVVVPIPMDADLVRAGLAAPGSGLTTVEASEVLDPGALGALAEAHPQAYTINNGLANAAPLHAAGVTGSGIVVAVIDSGLRPGFPHIAGGIVGCDNFVPSGTCSNSVNNSHGTFVAGMIRANVVFTFAEASALRQAILAHCPSCFLDPGTNTQVPMIGTAPLSSIYALRVFPPTGGAQTSWILSAMERAIDLRLLHDAGQPGGQNVRVVNMSLGGPSIYAGRDMFDLAVAALLEHDIVPVIAAGNAGPSSLTLGSPSSAIGALSVGAASLPHNERILRDAQFGLGIGVLYRPFNSPQMAYFSSRGPNTDGRLSPHVVASGFASFGQGGGAINQIGLSSGTSFASPSVAGVAALLAEAHPGATARQLRNAIIDSANPNVLADGSTIVDQGAGYVDAAAASALLAGGGVADAVAPQGPFNKNVRTNVEWTTPLVVRQNVVVESVPPLRPGERYDILYDVGPNVRQVVVSLTDVTPSLPPAEQNWFFGDDVLLTIHSAKTSSIGQGNYQHFAFTLGGTFIVNEPEPGLLRVTVNGDWTNAGTVAANVTIVPLEAPLTQHTRQGKIAQSDSVVVPIVVPAGVSQAEFRLAWREDWGRYPSADLDMILVLPDGTASFAGATLNNPERVVVNNPAAGTWTVIVSGFELHTDDDRYELRVALDGKVVR